MIHRSVSVVENVGRPLVGLLNGDVNFYLLLPWRPTRGLPTSHLSAIKAM